MKFIVACLLSTVAILPPDPTALDAALARMDDYLTGYEPKLSELIADETMLQEMRHTPGRLMPPVEVRKDDRWRPMRTSGASRPPRGSSRSKS